MKTEQNSLDPRGSKLVDLESQRAVIAELMENIVRGVHTLIVGERGAGKTRLAEHAAARLGRPVSVFHFGGILDGDAFFGGVELRDGATRFVRSRFVESLLIAGLVIVLDELNRAPAPVLNALLSVMDHQRRLVLDLEDPARRVVELAPGVTILATANHGAEHTGIEPLDAALQDRFGAARLAFPAEEAELLVATTGVSKADAAKLVKVARAIRAQFARGALPATISTRRLLDAGALVAAGHAIESSLERNYHAYDAEGIAALRTTVRVALGRAA